MRLALFFGKRAFVCILASQLFVLTRASTFIVVCSCLTLDYNYSTFPAGNVAQNLK